MRLRSSLSFAVHKYFNDNGFYYMHTPIITGSDAEGAGEIFRVTGLDPKNPPLTDEGSVNYSEDFFGKETNLTVSGQLEAETYAMSLGKVYTFGPTFRAENSNTSRHLSEFWMIEPEVAFMDLAGNMDLAEDFMKSVLSYILEHNKEDLEFLNKRLLDEEKTKPQAERSDMSLIEKIKFVVDNNFKRVSYTEAIDILRNCKPNKKKKFKYIIEEWGADLQSEHERFLVEKHFKCPVILFDYPANIKAFYMRLNEDGKTVRAMDILFPGIGEMVGGSQREERLDVLKEKMKALDIDEKELWWYLDLRKYGTAVHSGFGLGFERLVMFATGMGNIRDVIPYPRTPQNAEF
jgi:asparaginyl-tRNA synthetase